MEKTYDLICIHGILMDINEAVIEEKIFKFNKTFSNPDPLKSKPTVKQKAYVKET